MIEITDKTFEYDGVTYSNSNVGLKKFIRNVILPKTNGIFYTGYDHLILNGTDIKLWYSKLVKGLGYWKTRKPGILKEVYSYLLEKNIKIQSIEIIPQDEIKETENEVRIEFTF